MLELLFAFQLTMAPAIEAPTPATPTVPTEQSQSVRPNPGGGIGF